MRMREGERSRGLSLPGSSDRASWYSRSSAESFSSPPSPSLSTPPPLLSFSSSSPPSPASGLGCFLRLLRLAFFCVGAGLEGAGVGGLGEGWGGGEATATSLAGSSSVHTTTC